MMVIPHQKEQVIRNEPTTEDFEEDEVKPITIFEALETYKDDQQYFEIFIPIVQEV